jgi:ATP-binding protein involved in chromosome partitioning
MSVATTVTEIVEPLLRRSLGELGMVEGNAEAVTLVLPVLAWPTQSDLESAIAAAVPTATLTVRGMTDAELTALRNQLRGAMTGTDGVPTFLERNSTTRVLGISSGKGGVGKSSVTVNVAIALAQSGATVAILDADVYGFSIPKMMGGAGEPVVLGDVVIPTVRHGVRTVSMGYFVDDDQPVLWRGPMLHKAVSQLITETWWDAPDFLLIDMPPGTGDVALTLSEILPRIEIFVVTTPQPAAQRVAQRSALAARTLQLSVRGVIENMSWFVADDGTRYELFGAGGGDQLASDLKVALLAQIPLEPALRAGGDNGAPLMVSDPQSPAGQAFTALAERIKTQGPARRYAPGLTVR